MKKFRSFYTPLTLPRGLSPAQLMLATTTALWMGSTPAPVAQVGARHSAQPAADFRINITTPAHPR